LEGLLCGGRKTGEREKGEEREEVLFHGLKFFWSNTGCVRKWIGANRSPAGPTCQVSWWSPAISLTTKKTNFHE
jgi:hypothetical protein